MLQSCLYARFIGNLFLVFTWIISRLRVNHWLRSGILLWQSCLYARYEYFSLKSISLSHFNYAYFVGCNSADQCPAGYYCDETSHTCLLPPCEDNSYCELGPCDTQYGFNYTTCSFCLYGECQPGCQSDQSCPSGYVCDEDSHECEAVSGKGLLGSINFRTSVPCSICNPEGVSAQLLAEKNALFPDGFPCNTSLLDHADTFDYGGSFGSWTSFDGTLNGSYSQEEVSMMGSCYEVSS